MKNGIQQSWSWKKPGAVQDTRPLQAWLPAHQAHYRGRGRVNGSSFIVSRREEEGGGRMEGDLIKSRGEGGSP